MNTESVLPDPIESTRKAGAQIQADILQRLALVTQTHAADCMGVSPSTVSRMLEDVGRLAQLLAAIGLQVASTDSMVVDSDDLFAMKRMAAKYLQADIENHRKGMHK